MPPGAGSDRHRGAVLLAAACDVTSVVVFAGIGRRSHSEGLTTVGLLTTAWPFVLGAACGWALSRAWREPAPVLRTGVVVWASTVVVAMAARRLTGDGTAPAFVLVAATVLGGMLLGWRTVARLFRRRVGAARSPERATTGTRAARAARAARTESDDTGDMGCTDRTVGIRGTGGHP